MVSAGSEGRIPGMKEPQGEDLKDFKPWHEIKGARPAGHVVGAIATLWGVGAWVEWLAIPMLHPDRGGPVPYMDFAFEALVLTLWCFANALATLLWPWTLAWYWRVVYALAPAS